MPHRSNVCRQGHPLHVSGADYGGGIHGWVCDSCGRHGSGGRWLCTPCSCDLCFACLPRVSTAPQGLNGYDPHRETPLHHHHHHHHHYHHHPRDESERLSNEPPLDLGERSERHGVPAPLSETTNLTQARSVCFSDEVGENRSPPRPAHAEGGGIANGGVGVGGCTACGGMGGGGGHAAQSQIDALHARVAALEKENRFLRRQHHLARDQANELVELVGLADRYHTAAHLR